MNAAQEADDTRIQEQLRQILKGQKDACLTEGPVSAETRIERLNRVISQLDRYQQKIVAALNEDFGQRSSHHTLLTDVAASVVPLVHARKHVRAWMKSRRRSVMFPLNLLGARARVEYQPLGTVGIVSPWNFPVNLSFGPLAQVLAAGNRAMIKPSEFTPHTSALIDEMISEVFDPTEIKVVTGGAELGQTFTSLPFDHLIFTGATSVARHVMRAAAENLVPLTLELGGKSPVILGRSAKLKLSCERIMFGKMMNAGQVCLAPDYLFVAEEQLAEVTELLQDAVKAMYPSILNNPDLTTIINQRHYQRLLSYLDDARQKGAGIIEINPANEDLSAASDRRIAPTLVMNPSDDMLIMQEEIFGPLLPIKTYQHIDEVLHYINAHPRPLGLYYFGHDENEENQVLQRTTSGGVSLNDVIMHVTQEDLPFGGIGPSGMGCYHGFEGFKTFSHAKAIFRQTNLDLASLIGLKPPFGEKTRRIIAMQMKH